MAKNKKLKLTVDNLVTKDSSGSHPKPNGKVDENSHIVVLKEGGSMTAEIVGIIPLVQDKEPQKTEYEWLCNMVQTINFKASDAIGWTGPKRRFLFPKVIEGGGMVWVEAFEKGTEPTNSLKNGYLIAAKGKPAILSAIWREYSPNNDGKDITKSARKFGDTVQLHIYTQALYGQDVEITLMDHDLLDADDNLAPIPRTDGKPEYEKDKKTPKITLKKFTREVKIYTMLEDERSRPSSIQISDFIQQDKPGSAPGASTGAVRINKTQKVVLDVFIDDLWAATAGDSLEIYPVVKIISQANAKDTPLTKDYITVKGNINKETALSKVGNKPVIVGDIPTNPKRFNPCKYAMIKVKDKEGEWPVFDENVLEYTDSNNLVFEVIAGEDNAKQTITLTLIDFVSNNDECTGNPKHKGHSIIYYSLISDGYKDEDEKNKRPEDKDSALKVKGTNPITVLGVTAKRKTDHSKSYTKIIKHSDTELVFDAMYKYSMLKADGTVDWERIWGYFWLPSVKTDKYPIITQSCRWKHNLDFIIYPDIKWSLIFGFNVNKEKLETLFPGWCAEKKVKRYEKIGKKITRKIDAQLDRVLPDAISAKERKAINNDVKGAFTDAYGTPVAAKKKTSTTQEKGKLSTLVDILKEVEISLKTEFNAGQNQGDITQKFVKSVYDKMGGMFDLVTKAVEIIEGKHDPSPNAAGGNESINEFISKDGLQSRYKHLVESLKRPPQEVEILYPKIEFSASWQYESIDGEHYPKLKSRKGLSVDVKLKAEPLIGVEIRWHILDLLARRHPIAYAVLAAVKTLLAALGDNPDGIKVDFWVKGTIGAEVDFQHNLLAGPKEFTAKGSTALQAGVELDITIKGSIVQGSYEAVAKLGFGAAAQVGMGIEVTLGVDFDGFFTEASLKFEGLKLTFKATAEASLNKLSRSKKGDKLEREQLMSSGGSIEGEITLGEHTFKTDKIYFKKFENEDD
ncbi:hypothetical protein [Mucilaginibacter polytrichastri]|uniref:Uncharacterized protein n=1 Tax=Mucilaginibacter polytrichastri TaxID=1302689 RepID=A0A1Q5ZYZ2_9SPHI|nr:hypothetical protein [Mucilaginibacter polytrichastri]OKS86983.1 hypothetical protein RG47T_2441 [Mucilaginibacter polytrichastri]SFS85399.1 hypothetical protein SAMN04487890_10550 [Mucilaginibacter polytrichastri]